MTSLVSVSEAGHYTSGHRVCWHCCVCTAVFQLSEWIMLSGYTQSQDEMAMGTELEFKIFVSLEKRASALRKQQHCNRANVSSAYF